MRTLIFLALVFLSSSHRALAWSPPGHMIVTAVAYDQLSPAERAKLDGILLEHPKYNAWRETYPVPPPDGVPLGKFIAMLASLYPDDIRNHDDPDTFTEWHYIDYPLIPPDFPMKLSPTPGDDILTGIAKSRRAVLKLVDQYTTRSRAKMLSYLLHLVGDIHQPLHCETLFDENLHEPDGDRGGNNVWVRPSTGTAIKLHAYWDQQFGTGGALFQPRPPALVVSAAKLATELAKKYPRTAFPNIVTHYTPESWSLESRELAINDVWLRHGLKYGLTEQEAPALPEGYEAKAHALAEKQVTLGGHRLADQLHEVLKDQ